FWIGIINLVLTFIAEIAFIQKSSSFLQITGVIPCIGFLLHSVFKLLYFYANSGNIVRLIEGLNSFLSRDEEIREFSKIKIKLRNTLKFGAFYGIFLSTAVWMCFMLFPLAIPFKELILSNQRFLFKLPYTPDTFPIESQFLFYLLYISQVLGGTFQALIYVYFVVFIFNMILLICMNFDYIEDNIENGLENFNILIQKHQRILELSKIAQNLFSLPILVNFISSIFIICFVSFQTTVNVPLSELFKYGLFFVFQTTQIAVISNLGEYLTFCIL
uniref:Odorant receptor n=1 Tax=Megaselia scalaris TaxID=36166 RepID=T1GT15_MEGSC